MPTLFARAFLAVLVLRACTCSNGDGAPDPCRTQNGGCDAHATCADNNGVAECDCMPGYAGDGHTCTHDPCLVSNGGCSANATCTAPQGVPVCNCLPGYQGNGVTCTEIDECLSGTARCSTHATCTNTPGSYTCTCNPGWSGNGQTCSQNQTCSVNNGGCSTHATCTQLATTVTCTCNSGYIGSGYVCSVDPNGLSMACQTPDGTQSSCSSNLVCTPVSPLNMCTRLQCAGQHTVGGFCGKTETGLPNVCLSTAPGESWCARGCTPGVVGTCVRSDFSCWTGTDSSGNVAHFCFPDCRVSGVAYACAYGSSCDMSTGQCMTTPCDQCPAGQVCFTDNTQLPPAMSCVPDCTMAPDSCPAGRACNPQTSACDILIHSYGGLCGNVQGVQYECDSASVCVTFSAIDQIGECLATCMSDADCAAGNGARCNFMVTQSDGTATNVCEPPLCQPTSATCADGATCRTIENNHMTISACLPPD